MSVAAAVFRAVKPHVISLFADMVMAIEGDAAKYTGLILSILQEAGMADVIDDADDEDVEYINSLLEAILDAYTGLALVRALLYCCVACVADLSWWSLRVTSLVTL